VEQIKPGKAIKRQEEMPPQQQLKPPAPINTNNDQVMGSNSDSGEDERMRAEKDILNTHLEAVREEAQLI
jgi:hypothetical protein